MKIKLDRIMLNKSFYQRYPDKETFINMFKNSPLTFEATNEEIEHIYIKLVGEYMRSTFKYVDELQQDIKIMDTIHDYYPNLKKRTEIQDRILSMSLEEVGKGGTFVRSGMVHPDQDNISPTDANLPFVSNKSLSSQQLSEIQSLQRQYNMIIDGLWDEFIKRFSNLFVVFIIGTDNLIGMDNEIWNEGEKK